MKTELTEDYMRTSIRNHMFSFLGPSSITFGYQDSYKAYASAVNPLQGPHSWAIPFPGSRSQHQIPYAAMVMSSAT